MRKVFYIAQVFIITFVLSAAVIGGGVDVPEVVVEAEHEETTPIHKAAHPLVIKTSLIDSGFTALDEEILAIAPLQGLDAYLENLPLLTSRQPIHPWLPPLVSQPVVTFYPEKKGEGVTRWEMIITDYRGEEIKRFGDRGKPPSEITWDGRDAKGEILRVGYPYSFIFITEDRGTNLHTYMGETFVIDALKYHEGNDLVIRVVGRAVFLEEESIISENGLDMVGKAADEIRRQHGAPFLITVQAKESKLAKARADTLANHLSRELVFPRQSIKVAWHVEPEYKIEEDGFVQVTLRHVRR